MAMKGQSKMSDELLDGKLLAKMAQGGAASLRMKADEVNKLNVFPVPDGDTGDNMSLTIESGVAAIENTNTTDLASVMKKLSRGMLLGARGNSGVILSQFFAGIAKGLEPYSEADARCLGDALSEGVKQAYLSVLTPTEGTILTVAREAVEYAVAKITDDTTIQELFSDLIKEMYASLLRTPERLAVLKEAGVIDSGGAGLFYIMDGFYRVLNGEEISDVNISVTAESHPIDDFSSFGPDSEMTYGYCTELLLQLQSSKVDVDTFDQAVITDFLQTIGDSIVAFKVDSIVKIHVHTMTPEKVLEYCRGFGEFLKVKIENMSVQHSENTVVEAEVKEEATAAPQERKKYGVVAVCNGEGIKDTFTQLGTDCIVDGGQTQNPSTQDFIEAFKRINAEHIFVFPNNGNIIMAATQAAELYQDASIHVIPSKNLGAGYVALALMNPAEELDSLIEQFTEAAASVETGYISPSIRDADLNGIHITNGDFIGFVGKEMMVSHPDREQSAYLLISKMLDNDEKFMLTVFIGKDADRDAQQKISEYMETTHQDIETYFIEGGQEIYPYIFVAE
ncbi:MAG: DAK2 domain-containing protein [Ruminococcaceae bacterium]|nr:DAK2 domain-containing protein [Oscillospiraceae bacterium]